MVKWWEELFFAFRRPIWRVLNPRTCSAPICMYARTHGQANSGDAYHLFGHIYGDKSMSPSPSPSSSDPHLLGLHSSSPRRPRRARSPSRRTRPHLYTEFGHLQRPAAAHVFHYSPLKRARAVVVISDPIPLHRKQVSTRTRRGVILVCISARYVA